LTTVINRSKLVNMTPKELAVEAAKNKRNPFSRAQRTSWRNKNMGFDKATEARRAARMHADKPGATRKIEDKRSKAPKHVKPLQEEQS
jgi:hypothetical protein